MTDTALTRTLTEQLDALRALAHQLVRDPEYADDAVQDACVAVLRRQGRAPRTVRSWFGNVVQNAARQRVRGERRRRERERTAHELRDGERGDGADPAAAFADLALHRRLLAHVSELPARQRAVVTLRFWRGASTREVAATLGITARAVRDRQQEALRELRRRLDAESGSRRAWALPLAGWVGSGPAGAEPAATASTFTLFTSWFVMPAKLLAVSGLVLAVVAAAFVFGSDPADPALDPGADRTAVVDESTTGAARLPEQREVERAAVETPVAVEGPKAPAEVRMLRGVVADLAGKRLAGVPVVFDPDGDDQARSEPVITASDGAFVLPFPEVKGNVTTVEGGDWATVRRYRHDDRGNPESVVVLVAPARDYAGTVIDPDGAPVSHAQIVIDVPEVGRTRLLDGVALHLPHDLGMTETDGSGRFAFADIGWLPGCKVVARRSPFGGAEVELPAVSTGNLLLQMSAPTPQDAIYGIVLDASGTPVPDASVAAGALAGKTARDGTFRALWRTETPPAFVSVVVPRLGAATATLRRGPGEPGWSADNPVVLQLPRAPLRLTGRVVDSDGNPVAGARVWTPDLTFFGQVVRDAQGHEVYSECSVEEQFGDHGMLEVRTVTDQDGNFELAGVLPRDYALFALDPRTAAAVGPVVANANGPVELRLGGEPRRRVAGRIRTAKGEPLAGVHVRLAREMPWQRPERSPDPWTGSPMAPPRASSGRFGEGAVTDDDGRFELAPVAVTGVSLRFSGDNLMMPRPFALASASDLENLDIELPARSSIRVVLESVEAADSFSLVGPNDGHVTILLRAEGLLLSVGKVEFAAGVAPVVMTDARPVTLILWRGDEEIRRQPLELRPGGPHEIRL